MNEKRMFARIESQMSIKYIVVTENQVRRQIDNTRTVDISVSGVRFEAEEELPPGTKIVLEIKLVDVDRTVTPAGRVAWCKRRGDIYEVGAELNWLSFQKEDRMLFAEHINRVLNTGLE